MVPDPDFSPRFLRSETIRAQSVSDGSALETFHHKGEGTSEQTIPTRHSTHPPLSAWPVLLPRR